MKRILYVILVAAALSVCARKAAAQNAIGANVGYNLDAEEWFVGGQFRFAPAALPVIINPSLETYFVDNATWLRVDIDALYPFGTHNAMFTPYAGAGLGIGYVNPDVGKSDTNTNLNLIAGADFGMGRVRPFAETRIELGGGTPVSLRGGLLIGL